MNNYSTSSKRNCRHIEKFNPKVFGPYMAVTYADGETKEFIGYTCEYCPKCGQRIHPDLTKHSKDFHDEEETE